MTALLALALAAAPGCPAALAAAAAPAEVLATRASGIVAALEEAGPGGPTAALGAAAQALEAAGAEPGPQGAAADSFRAALARHCALAAGPPLPQASAADRAALEEILARPELARGWNDPDALRRALGRLWDRLVELLGTGEAERYASLGRALFLGVAAAAAALGASALRRRGRRGRAASGAAPAGEPPAPTAAADGSAALAEEALGRGDGRGAVRFALLAALGALERDGWVPRGRALTNAELVAAAAGAPTAAEVAALASAFDRAVYGGQPVGLDEARAALQGARRIVGAAGGSR